MGARACLRRTATRPSQKAVGRSAPRSSPCPCGSAAPATSAAFAAPPCRPLRPRRSRSLPIRNTGTGEAPARGSTGQSGLPAFRRSQLLVPACVGQGHGGLPHRAPLQPLGPYHPHERALLHLRRPVVVWRRRRPHPLLPHPSPGAGSRSYLPRFFGPLAQPRWVHHPLRICVR